MPRDIDDRKKRKALRKLRKAQALAEQGLGPPLSDWERTFLEEVEARIETYGAAFGDPDKGALDEPLSALQQVKLKEIDKKARGKRPKRSGFSRKASPTDPEAPDAREDPAAGPGPQPVAISRLARPQPPASPAPGSGPPKLRIIPGGRSE